MSTVNVNEKQSKVKGQSKVLAKVSQRPGNHSRTVRSKAAVKVNPKVAKVCIIQKEKGEWKSVYDHQSESAACNGPTLLQ